MLSTSLTTAVQCNRTVFRLTSSASSQANKEEIYDALLLQKVDIVLTAHPTEVNRRTLLRKYKEISESLAKLDKKDLSPYEKSECEEALRREIYSIWGSDEIRREKPTPQTEAKGEFMENLILISFLQQLSAHSTYLLRLSLPLHLPFNRRSRHRGDCAVGRRALLPEEAERADH
jgi:phosphoenolpyruvate carboxylase